MEASTAGVRLSNALLVTSRIEGLIFVGFAFGGSLWAVHRAFGESAERAGGRVAKVFTELQRKSFHMIGGCIICATYHWGMKRGLLMSAYQPCSDVSDEVAGALPRADPMDAGVCFLAACLVSWILEASRFTVPAVQKWYLGSFKGLIRQKELTRAAGIAYFLPGSLVAMLAGPSNVAILGILFLSLGDAAASIGTAAGRIPVGASSRKVEGSIACFTVCLALGLVAGLPGGVAMVASVLVTLGELLAEIIGLDDNFVIPVLGVLGVRLGLCVQMGQLFMVMAGTLAVGVVLGVIVGSTTPKDSQTSVGPRKPTITQVQRPAEGLQKST